MKTTTMLLGAALSLVCFNTARAVTMYGALSNFDAINDTGYIAHGFEIDLEGCSPSDVVATFGSPYNRYGDPVITTSLTGGTLVRYESLYNSVTVTWAVGTDPGSLADTGGHSLFYPAYGGDSAYPNVPGDHFGVALNINPTSTAYHWLLEDTAKPGTLVLAGTSVKIPAPVMTVVPPANQANPAGVQAVVPAPAPENQGLFGEAIWAKVFTTEVQSAGHVELNQLVLGNAAVPPETETEIEWQLLQAGKAGFEERGDAVDLGADNKSVTRRYEFYKYLGEYDPESHEALSDIYDPALVGDFLGAQNVAANLVVPEPSTLILLGTGVLGLLAYAWRRRS